MVLANSAGVLSIFEFNDKQASQIFKYKIQSLSQDRDLLTSGCKSLSEKWIAFITSNYSVPGQAQSSIHIFEIDAHKTALLPFKSIHTENLDPKQRVLTSVNCDLQVGEQSIPKFIAFIQNSDDFYEFDLNGGELECKTVKVGTHNLRNLSYFENSLLGIDQKLQVLEISKIV